MDTLKQCGHRIAPKHFIKISKLARKWKTPSEASALRRIIDEA